MNQQSHTRLAVQWSGLAAGPLLAVLCFLFLPPSYTDANGQIVAFAYAGRVTLAVMIWMAVWWLSEAVEITTTALLPLLLLPILGYPQVKIEEVAAPYADPLVFLFLGGFVIALSMQRWGLDRRIALTTLRLVGTRPVNMVGGFMLTTAVLSAFVSNTATTAMMLPIALSVVGLVRNNEGESAAGEAGPGHEARALDSNFALCMMLGIAYAASIGGVTTIIGTPTNAFLVGFVRDKIAGPYRMEVSYARWLLIGLPFVVVFLPLAWWLLTRVLYPIRMPRVEGGQQLIRRELQALGTLNRGEWITLIIFLATAATWITRTLLVQIHFTVGRQTYYPLGGLTDTGVALIAAILLFAIPVDVRKREFVMNWRAAKKLPWDILLLFGGGFSLAAAVKNYGVAEFIGSGAQFFAGLPPIVIVLVVTTTVILLTELTSNTPTTATLLPVLAALAPGMGVHPYLLVFPAAIAASCAFMLPVATPPNAIVFGSGYVTIPQMAKAGLWLNLIGVALVTVLSYLLLGPVVGINLLQ